MTQTEVTNFPGWALIVVAVSQVVFALAMIIIAGVMLLLVKQMIEILKEMQKIVAEDVRKDIMPSVVGTLRNVKSISDDARTTSTHVTGTVNRVSHVVGSIAGRLESPVIKTIGVVTGLAAGARALGGHKREVVVETTPKRRGFLGLFR